MDSFRPTLKLLFPFFVVLFLLRGILGSPAFTLWAEDGTIFLRQAEFGNLFDLYAGYLTLAPRLFAAVGAFLPNNYIATFYIVSSALICCIPVFYFLSERSNSYLPSKAQKVIASLVVVLLPGSSEVYGSLTNAQWYSVITIPAIVYATKSKYWFLDVIIVLLLGLTGPFSALLLFITVPLLIVRRFNWLKFNLNIPALLAMTVSGFVQFGIILSGDRGTSTTATFEDLLQAFYFDVSNSLTISLLGTEIASEIQQNPQPLLFSLIIAAVVLYAIITRKLHPIFISVLFLGAVSILGAVAENEIYRAVVKINLIDGARYRFPMIAALCLFFVSSRKAYLLVPAIIMFFVGFSSDFLHSRPSLGLSWSDALLQQKDGKVPIDPPGWVAFLE